MNFEQLLNRIRTMKAYEMSLDDMHNQLVNIDNVPEDIFYFAYKGVDLLDKEDFAGYFNHCLENAKE